MEKIKSLCHGHRFPVAVTSHAGQWYFRFQLSLRDIEEPLFELVSSSVTRRSAAGATNSARASHIASRLLVANLAAHGFLTKCSLRCAVSLTCYGGQSTSTVPNSTSCCGNVAIRPQQSASSNARSLPVPTRPAGSSPMSCAVIRPRKPKYPSCVKRQTRFRQSQCTVEQPRRK
jgi:hypothetical protein